MTELLLLDLTVGFLPESGRFIEARPFEDEEDESKQATETSQRRHK